MRDWFVLVRGHLLVVHLWSCLHGRAMTPCQSSTLHPCTIIQCCALNRGEVRSGAIPLSLVHSDLKCSRTTLCCGSLNFLLSSIQSPPVQQVWTLEKHWITLLAHRIINRYVDCFVFHLKNFVHKCYNKSRWQTKSFLLDSRVEYSMCSLNYTCGRIFHQQHGQPDLGNTVSNVLS